MANTFYTLFAVHRFFVISPLFCCCSRIVYSELYDQCWRLRQQLHDATNVNCNFGTNVGANVGTHVERVCWRESSSIFSCLLLLKFGKKLYWIKFTHQLKTNSQYVIIYQNTTECWPLPDTNCLSNRVASRYKCLDKLLPMLEASFDAGQKTQ